MNTAQAFCMLLLAATGAPCLAAQSVADEQLVACAEAYLRARSLPGTGRLELVSRAELAPSALHGEGGVRLQARPLDGLWPRRRVGVPVDVWQGDRIVQTRMVWFSVRWWQHVPIYATDARSGTPMSELPTRTAEVDMAGKADLSISMGSLGSLENWRLRRSVRAGQPVLGSDLVPRPPVSRDEAVSLSLRRGAVALTVPAIASADAAVGQWVQVRVEGAERSVLAKVVAPNEVAIEQ